MIQQIEEVDDLKEASNVRKLSVVEITIEFGLAGIGLVCC